MMAVIWARVQPWIAAAGLVLGALVSAFIMGRRTGGERARAQAAEAEQSSRRAGDAAARDAERDGAAERLRSGRF